MRSLPAEDLYFALREIGLEDGADIVGMASPNQFRSFVDLDAWDRDQPDQAQLILWLRLALEGGGRSGDFRAKRAALDAEVVVLLLKTQTVAHQLEEGVDPVLTSDNWLYTAERKYLVEILAEGDDGVTIRRLLEDFIEENPFEATRLFEAVRWEVGSELEENCRRWRTGRLRDMGFPEMEEALRIWTPLPSGWKPRDAAPVTGTVSGVPALLFVGARGTLLLDSVSARLDDDARARFNPGLVYLLNCALVADGVDPRDLDRGESTLAATRDQLSLGLELASEGDEDRALALLATTPPVELFRLAVTRLTPLQREATRVSQALAFGQGLATSLDTPEAESLAALRRRRPRLYDPAPPGEEPRKEGPERALRTRADLVTAEAVLQRARAIAALLPALGLDTAAVRELAERSGHAPSAVTAAQLARTVLIRTTLGLETGALPRSIGPRLDALFSGGLLTAQSRTALDAAAKPALDLLPDAVRGDATRVIAGWIDTLQEELGPPSNAGPLDPRFVTSLLFTP